MTWEFFRGDYLVKASPQLFLTVEYIDEGDLIAIEELKEAGYVTTHKTQGLPDGRDKELSYLVVIPNNLGYEAQKCLLALQHNKSNEHGLAALAALLQ